MDKRLSNAINEGGKIFIVATSLVIGVALGAYIAWEMLWNDNMWPCIAAIILIPSIGTGVATYYTEKGTR